MSSQDDTETDANLTEDGFVQLLFIQNPIIIIAICLAILSDSYYCLASYAAILTYNVLEALNVCRHHH